MGNLCLGTCCVIHCSLWAVQTINFLYTHIECLKLINCTFVMLCNLYSYYFTCRCVAFPAEGSAWGLFCGHFLQKQLLDRHFTGTEPQGRIHSVLSSNCGFLEDCFKEWFLISTLTLKIYGTLEHPENLETLCNQDVLSHCMIQVRSMYFTEHLTLSLTMSQRCQHLGVGFCCIL